MNNSKTCTPGPWLRDERDFGFNLISSWEDEEHLELICQGYMGEANARLIAAAPDLLEALEAMFSAFGCDDLLKTFISGKAIEAAQAAQSAIAKAKGEK